MIKIGSGKFRGRNLQTPRGMKTRPSSGRLKKSLFDILAPDLPGARVLDLFAGAGAVGIEALSRGAGYAVFVERSRLAAQVVRRNLDELVLGEVSEVIQHDVGRALEVLAKRKERFDVAFLDPPYRDELGAIADLVEAAGVFEPNVILVWEHQEKQEPGEEIGRLTRYRQLAVGDSAVSFYRS